MKQHGGLCIVGVREGRKGCKGVWKAISMKQGRRQGGGRMWDFRVESNGENGGVT